MAAVVLGVRGNWGAEMEMEWGEEESVLLLNQRREGEGACTGNATATASCRSAGARTGEECGVANAREARSGELERRSGWRLTRGVDHGRRWREAARNGGRWRSSRGNRGAEETPEEEEEGKRSEGLSWKCRNFRDCTVNKNSPLIQSSNEKMVKMKVVELFKTYNFALGLKFRNRKHIVLFYYFALYLNFT
jgi:hypothetical protein